MIGEGAHELVGDLLGRRPAGADCFGAGDLRGLAEAGRRAERVELVDEIADRRAGGEARGGVALAAFCRDEKLVDRAIGTLYLRCPMKEVLGLTRGLGDRHDVAIALDGEAGVRLAGFLGPADDASGPPGLDPDADPPARPRLAAAPV